MAKSTWKIYDDIDSLIHKILKERKTTRGIQMELQKQDIKISHITLKKRLEGLAKQKKVEVTDLGINSIKVWKRC